MNKTVTVNISGIIFNIDEEAYKKLQRYLEKIRGYFSASDGRDEIMADIEGRIAELFQEQTEAGKQVIGMIDVDRVIGAMGQPEDFAEAVEDEDEQPQPKARSRQHQRNTNKSKTLYRDPDRSVVGGVCAGLGHYFGQDALWFRLGFLALFFLGGGGLIFYIILWAIVPTADTTAEKLEMEGEPVTVSSISKKVEEGIENLSERIRDVDTEGMADTAKNGFERVLSAIANVLKLLISAIGKVLGVVLVGGGLILFIVLLLGLIGPGSTINLNPDHIDAFSLQDFAAVVFADTSQKSMAIIGLIMVIGIPLIGLAISGFRLLLGYRKTWKGLSLGLIILWIGGVGILGMLALEVRQDFQREAVVTELIQLPPMTVDTATNDTVWIPEVLDLRAGEDIFHARRDRNRNFRDKKFRARMDEDAVYLGAVELDVVRAASDTLTITVYKMAHGETKKEARLRAKSIDYTYKVDGDRAWFNPWISIDPSMQWRDQEVEVVIELPVGNSVHFSPGMEKVIYNIENVTDTWDRSMIGRTWTMTEQGLECLGCEFDDDGDIISYHERIPDSGVYFHKDARDGSTTLVIQ